jgi:hypothetical protein
MALHVQGPQQYQQPEQLLSGMPLKQTDTTDNEDGWRADAGGCIVSVCYWYESEANKENDDDDIEDENCDRYHSFILSFSSSACERADFRH